MDIIWLVLVKMSLCPPLQTQLLHTNNDSSILTYQFSGNQSSVDNAGNCDDVDYNITIRVSIRTQQFNCLYMHIYVTVYMNVSYESYELVQ